MGKINKEILNTFFIKNLHRFLGDGYGIESIKSINLYYNDKEIEVNHIDSMLYFTYEDVSKELLKWLLI